jgi:CubicO group peptidase (beta-lactamase class C family)
MRKLRLTTVCLLAGLLVLLPLAACGAAEKADLAATKAFARTEAWKAITSGKTGSATVAVMDNGVTVYAEGFGMADREKNLPVDKNTLFNIGSISKVYVATAIMLLVDDGKVRLDAPAATYLPEFTMLDERYKDITVRMLLNHTSGLPGTLGPSSFGFQYNKDFYRNVLDILAQSHLKHRPGAMNPYCNDGFTLAEMIVAKVSGMSYLDFLQQRIFTPLSLKYTGTGVGERPEKNLAVAKAYTPAGKALPLEVLSLLGSGGLSATAEDVCRFAESFSGGGHNILSPASLAEMKKVQPCETAVKLGGKGFSYGLGWDFAELTDLKAKGIHVLGKSGGTGEYNSMMFTVPDKRISVAVIQTGSAGNSMEFALALLKTYLTEKGLLANAPDPVAAPPKGEPIPPGLAAYEGYYVKHGGLIRASLDPAANALTIYDVSGDQETKAFSAVYNNGCFYGPGGKYYFVAVDGRSYLFWNWPTFNVDSVFGEKVERSAAPQEPAVGIDGRRWLRRNAKAYEGPTPDGILTSRRIPALPGYISFGVIMKVTGPTTASYPVSHMRDLFELSLSERDGVTWAWISGMLYSSADAARTFAGGTAGLTIGSAGYNEWLKVGADSVLGFTKPAQGRVVVFDPDGAPVYDSITDKGDVFVPAGCFVSVAGEPGDTFTVQAR